MELTPDLRFPDDRSAEPTDLRAAEWAIWNAPASHCLDAKGRDGVPGIDLAAIGLAASGLREPGPQENSASEPLPLVLRDGGASAADDGEGLAGARAERLIEPRLPDALIERGVFWLLAASLAAHLCLLLALAALSPKQLNAERSSETPVEIIVETPASKPSPPAKGAQSNPPETRSPVAKPPHAEPPESKAAEKAPEIKPPEVKPQEVKPQEVKPPESKPPESKPPEPKPPVAAAPEAKQPESKQSEIKQPEAKPPEKKPPEARPARPNASPQKPAEAKRGERKPPAAAAAPKPASGASAKAAAPAQAASRFDKFADSPTGDLRLGAGQGGLRLPFDNGPETFRAVAVPLPVEGGDELMSYKEIVFGLLERAKQYPPSARERGAKGIAVVSFTLDDAGELTNVSLVRSSGDSELDVESLALVARAAPFPKPPEGAQREFAAEVTFGLDQRD